MRVRFGTCLFDSATRVLKRNDEELRLSPRAFRLLEILLEHRPEAVSQKALYDELWPDTFVEATNLHNLISQIRSVIGDEDRTLIRTIYGYGFAFAGEATPLESQQGALGLSSFILETGGIDHPLREGENVVGRYQEASVQILLPSISRQHARLTIRGNQVTLEDLNSKNGTFADGCRVDNQVTVRAGSEIVFGEVRSRLRRCAPQDPTATLPPQKKQEDR